MKSMISAQCAELCFFKYQHELYLLLEVKLKKATKSCGIVGRMQLEIIINLMWR